MKIIFTAHAEERIKKRRISKEEILEAIKKPEKITKKRKKFYIQKTISEGKIEVIYEKEENFIKIITVYWI